MKIAIWWIFPCKATSGIFRELSALGYQIDVFLMEGMSQGRAKLGWKFPDYGNANLTVLPEGEKQRQSFVENFEYEKYDLHLVNGFYGTRDLNKILRLLCARKVWMGIMTEAPFNEFHGVKRFLKYAYLAIVVPIKAGKVARRADFVCCLSGSNRISFRWLRWFGFIPARIFPFGYFPEQPAILKEKVDAYGHPPLILCTGYLRKNKGHLLLLKALNCLKEHRVEFVCEITGYGPEEKTLKDYIDKNQLSNHIKLIGVVDTLKLHELLAQADIFVAPGYEEPWGVRVNEALQSGCPVVVSDKIGASELVYASGGGETFRSGDVFSLVRVLEKLLTDMDCLYNMKKRLVTYRSKIHPRSAAQFLHQIIGTVVSNKKAVDIPVWLMRD